MKNSILYKTNILKCINNNSDNQNEDKIIDIIKKIDESKIIDNCEKMFYFVEILKKFNNNINVLDIIYDKLTNINEGYYSYGIEDISSILNLFFDDMKKYEYNIKMIKNICYNVINIFNIDKNIEKLTKYNIKIILKILENQIINLNLNINKKKDKLLLLTLLFNILNQIAVNNKNIKIITKHNYIIISILRFLEDFKKNFFYNNNKDKDIELLINIFGFLNNIFVIKINCNLFIKYNGINLILNIFENENINKNKKLLFECFKCIENILCDFKEISNIIVFDILKILEQKELYTDITLLNKIFVCLYSIMKNEENNNIIFENNGIEIFTNILNYVLKNNNDDDNTEKLINIVLFCLFNLKKIIKIK